MGSGRIDKQDRCLQLKKVLMVRKGFMSKLLYKEVEIGLHT